MNLLLSLAIALTSPVDTATFAGGCFWSMERAFDQVPGVVAVTVGYAAGRVPHPSYDQVSTGRTGHLESVQVVRSEEHTSELQSRGHLVCRLLLEKKKLSIRIFLGSC